MNAEAWGTIILAFLALEGSIFAAWMNLRDRVTKSEGAIYALRKTLQTQIQIQNTTIEHITREGDDLRDRIALVTQDTMILKEKLRDGPR